MINWRLGLSWRTNSIGWAVIQLTEGRPASLVDMGVRIFSDGRSPGYQGKLGDPLAVERRIARAARRLRERRRRRIHSITAFMIKIGYLRQQELQTSQWQELNPYQLRSEALERALTHKELARILIHISRRRGFQSNGEKAFGVEAGDHDFLKGLKGQIEALRERLGGLTLGQYLWQGYQEKKTIRFKKGELLFYPDRQMYKEEFGRIKQAQLPYYANLDWDAVERILFFQRPLKPVERSKSVFYKNEPRAFKQQPSSHRLRIAKTLCDLKKIDHVQQTPLTKQEFQHLFSLLDKKHKVTFYQIRKELSTRSKFNLEMEDQTILLGNVVICEMRKLIGERLDTLSWEAQDALIEILLQTDDVELVPQLMGQGLTQEEALRLASYNPRTSTTNFSAKFQRDCLALMLEANLSYVEALERLGFYHLDGTCLKIADRLPYYGKVLQEAVLGAKPQNITFDCRNQGIIEELTYGKINNPTMHLVLRQTQRLVNRLIARFGRPLQIVFHLAQELKQSRKMVEELIKKKREDQKIREEVQQKWNELGLSRQLDDQDYKKYYLWKELEQGGNNHKCLYCGKIITLEQLLEPEIEIEHILPYSRTLDSSWANLTLAHRLCNDKKGNKTPYESFGNSFEQGSWDAIMERAQSIGKDKKFHPDAIKYYEDCDGAVEQQLNDTSYLALLAKKYLSCITHMQKIWSANTALITELRAYWNWNVVLNRGQKYHQNITDHRHHAVNALVIAMIDRPLLQEISKLNSHNGGYKRILPSCPIHHSVVEDFLKTVLVSYKPDHGYEGKIYKETALGKIKILEKIDLSDPAQRKNLQEKDLPLIRPKTIRTVLLKEWNDNKQQKKSPKEFSLFKANLANSYQYVIIPRVYYATRSAVTDWHSWQDIQERWIDPCQTKKLADYLKSLGVEQPQELTEKQWKIYLEKYSQETGTRKIRYIPKNNPEVTGIRSAPFKYYAVEDYLCVDIWAIPQKRKKNITWVSSFLD